jgi:hypothetical protein
LANGRVVALGLNVIQALTGASDAIRHWNARHPQDGSVRIRDTTDLGKAINLGIPRPPLYGRGDRRGDSSSLMLKPLICGLGGFGLEQLTNLVGSPGQPIRAQWNANIVNQARPAIAVTLVFQRQHMQQNQLLRGLRDFGQSRESGSAANEACRRIL